MPTLFIYTIIIKSIIPTTAAARSRYHPWMKRLDNNNKNPSVRENYTILTLNIKRDSYNNVDNRIAATGNYYYYYIVGFIISFYSHLV